MSVKSLAWARKGKALRWAIESLVKGILPVVIVETAVVVERISVEIPLVLALIVTELSLNL